MKELFQIGLLGIFTLIGVLLIFAIWLVPVIVSYVTGDWPWLFTYALWWIPAVILTAVVAIFFEGLLEISF
tara:strand:- start:25911 stop:26123 length:213 start_codon:yes stop_codon:yes gene_type:complete